MSEKLQQLDANREQSEMTIEQFRDRLIELKNTSGRNAKKSVIEDIYTEGGEVAITFLAGDEYEVSGLSKKSVIETLKLSYGKHIDDIDWKPTVTDKLIELENAEDKDYIPNQINIGANLSLSDLRDKVDTIMGLSGNDQISKLSEELDNISHPSVLTFVFLNDLSTGVSSKTITSALGIREYLPHYDNVVDILNDPNPSKVRVGRAFDPMLAKSDSHLPESYDGWVAQPKFDGNRLILHIKNGSVTAFTRGQNDETQSLPELEEIDWPTGNYIVDCEVIAENGSYKATSERIGRDAQSVMRDVDMQFFVFDCVYYVGENVSDIPYEARLELAEGFVDEVDHRLVEKARTFEDIEKAKKYAIEEDIEGIIVRDLTAEYDFGGRPKSMVKWKRTGETVDVIISDVLEGEGKYSNTLGKLAIESSDGVPLGKVGTGFTDDERDAIWDLYRSQERSVIGSLIEVKAEGYDDNGLRFPSFQRQRPNGSPDDIDRIEELLPTDL